MRAREGRGVDGAVIAAVLWMGCAGLSPWSVWAQVPPAAEQRAGEGRPTLTVSGSTQVTADPDEAVVRLGVAAQAAEAAAAQNRVNEIMQRILEGVTGLGVEARAVRTERLSLHPIYESPRRPQQGAEPEEPRIIGYRASNVVSVRLDDLTRVGDVIDAGIEAGANQLQGISFNLRDDATARSRAMRQAVQDARLQAEAIAEAMDMRLDGVAQVAAGGFDVRPPMPFQEARMDVAATPVQPGQVDVSATVSVTYYLREVSER